MSRGVLKRCTKCGEKFTAKGQSAKYCKVCKVLRRRELNTNWYKNNIEHARKKRSENNKKQYTPKPVVDSIICYDFGIEFIASVYCGKIVRCDDCRIVRKRMLHKLHARKTRLDAKYRIHYSISRRIRRLINNKSRKKTIDILNYSMEQLMTHLESLFTTGMSWDNYGFGNDKWNIDHIIPVASFSFSSYKDNQFKECWAISNLQPLWQPENIRKGVKVA